jgi:hypothetical protein
VSLDLTPEPEEIVQAEDADHPLQPFPVYTCAPVQTRELPGIRAGYATETGVTTSFGVRLLTMEPRRKSAVILATTQDIWISSSQAGAQSGAAGAFRVPKGLPFTIDHLDQVWCTSTTDTTDVSVLTTYWSE